MQIETKSKQKRVFLGCFFEEKEGEAYCIFEGKEKVGLSYDEGCLKVAIFYVK